MGEREGGIWVTERGGAVVSGLGGEKERGGGDWVRERGEGLGNGEGRLLWGSGMYCR